MGKIKDAEFWQSAKYNNASFIQYYNALTELAISMFEWKNLPESIDPRFLELILFSDGFAGFFYDEVMGYLALRVMIGGRLNVYQIPIMRRAYASNGYNKELNEENSVIIFNNMLHTNSLLEVENFSRKLWELDRSIEVNAKAQKTPILITCDESQRLTMKNVYMKYDGNEPVIFGDKNLSPNSIKVFTTGAPYVADKMYELKTQIWNEALTRLGISNINVVKKERLITDEVTRNLGGVLANRYSRLNARKQACEQINKMFNLDIDCVFREDYRSDDPDYLDEEGEIDDPTAKEDVVNE